MTHNVELIPSPDAREMPWFLRGSADISSATSVDEALALAGLDWEVKQEPVFQKLPGDRRYRPVPNRVLNVRQSDGEVLGIVTPKYNIVQNREGFDFLHILSDESKVTFDRAGEMETGKLVFVTLKLPIDLVVPNDESAMAAFLMVQNAHDGWRTLSASVQVIRLVCTNGLTRMTAFASWKLKHSSLFGAEKIQNARETLGLTTNYLDSYSETATLLAQTKLKKGQGDELLKLIFPVNAEATEAQIERSQFAGAREVWLTSETINPEIRDTAWGVLNAVAEFVDFASVYRSRVMSVEEARAESILFGPASWKKQRAFDVLVDFAKAA